MPSRGAPLYRLMTTSLLVIIAGCTGPFGPLNLGDFGPLGAVLGLSQADPLDGTSAPACVEVGRPATEIHQAMLDALNRYRVENGLNPLTYSKRLEAAADAHARDLWERDFFDHINPDGQDPGDRAVEAGFCHEYVGENIAAGQKSVLAVMQAWQNSPPHDDNMLYPDYSYAGMGYFVDPTGRKYWAQLFAFDVP